LNLQKRRLIKYKLLLYEAKRKVFWTGVRIPPGPPKGFLCLRIGIGFICGAS